MVIVSHNLHDVFEVADSITVLRLGQNVAEFKRTETNQQEVVQAITAGKLSKVPGLVDGRGGDGVTPPPRRHRGRRDATARRDAAARWWTDVKLGRARLAADHRRPDHHRDRLPVAERPLPHRRQLREPDRPVGGLHDDRHGHRLRAAARRDRPVGRLRLGRGGRDRRRAADPGRQRGVDRRRDRRSRSASGIAIGTFHGLLITKIGIPSFVVTLAGLIAWNGVVLLLIGSRGTVILQNDFLIGLANDFLPDGDRVAALGARGR